MVKTIHLFSNIKLGQLIWPDFCSAFNSGGGLRRLVCIIPGFGPFRCPVAQGPVQTLRSPRHEIHRNVANSRSLKSRKGLRRQMSSVLYAPSALPAMALPYESPNVPVGGGMCISSNRGGRFQCLI